MMDRRQGLLGMLAMATAAAGLGTGLAGCGTPASSLQMGLAPGEALQLRNFMPEALRGQVQLGEVVGGAETGRWWGSRISREALREALENALADVGLMVRQPPGGRYRLDARLAGQQQPLVPLLDAQVLATIDYQLTDTLSGQHVYQRSLRSHHTAALGDALLSQPERVRLANEGAMRESFRSLLRDFAELRLPPP